MSPRFRIISCLVWCLAWPAIAILLLMPLPFELISRSDLLGHFLLFAVMTVSIVAFARSRRQILALSLLAIAYGIALEFGQAYVPGRTFDVADAIANAIGGVAGCLGAFLLLERLIDRHGEGRPPSTTAGPSPSA
ncbi:MAG: VanZ family protein [Geminicoccaceae bacterium]